jgi:CheY-like chemotaxis protein
VGDSRTKRASEYSEEAAVKKKVLLCIDDELNGLLIRRMFLESQGYDVLIATHVDEGLHLFDQSQVDAVVLDYYMPEMDGGHLARKLKERRPEVPIVMLSAFITLPEYAMKNTDAYVVKGEAPRKLLNTLDDLLKKAA